MMKRIILKNRENNDHFATKYTTGEYSLTFKAYNSLFNLGKTFDEILVGEMFYFRNEKITFVVTQKQETKQGSDMTEHKGLPVAGYMPQTEEKVAMVNVNKELEERCLRRIEWFEAENAKAQAEYNKTYPNDIALLSFPAQKKNKNPPFKYPYDPRLLRLAFTGIQDAFMWMNRGVFQPSRAPLPEDSIDPNETTIKAMQDARAGVGMHQVDSVDELMSELHKDNTDD